MRSWANYRRVDATVPRLSGIPYAQIQMRNPTLHADGALAVSMACNHKRPRALVRPLAIGLIGLALAVVLWGMGYKLSLYRAHPSPAVRAGVAKLWVGPRSAAYIKSAPRKAAPPSAPEFQLQTTRGPDFSYSNCAKLDSAATFAHDAGFRLLLGTLRSPPPRYL
jgi:hypothetical protein